MLRPTEKLHHLFGVGDHHDAGLKSKRTNSSRMQGTASSGRGPSMSASVFSTSCLCPSYPNVRVFSTAGNPSSRRLRSDASSSTAAKTGRAKPVVAGVGLLAQAVLRIVQGL